MTNVLTTLPDPHSAGSIGWFLIIAVCIVTGANQVIRLFGALKETPPPAQTYVTKTELQVALTQQEQHIARLDSEVQTIRTEIREMGLRLDKNDEERSIAIHNRINGVEALANKILGKIERK